MSQRTVCTVLDADIMTGRAYLNGWVGCTEHALSGLEGRTIQGGLENVETVEH
jgi:hypothetical protein